MQATDTSKEISIVAEHPELPTVLAPKQISTLRRRTIFDLSTDEFNRIQLMAKMFATSSFNYGNNRQSDGDFALIMFKGLELGISPLAAVDMINIIKGRPTLDAKGMLALVKSSGLLENIDIDSTKERCIVTLKRIGNDGQVVSFTIEDAQKMGLTSRTQYQQQPEIMLMWRAVTKAMRQIFPDIILGLYTPEELSPDNTIVYEDGSIQLSYAPQTSETQKALNNEAIQKIVKWANEKGYGNNEMELLNLLDKKDWAFAGGDGRKACEAIESAHNKLLEQLKQQNKTSVGTMPALSEPNGAKDEPETLSEEDMLLIEDWLKLHFNLSQDEAIEKLPDGDLSRFSSAQAAQDYILEQAKKSLWPVVTKSCKYIANSKHILFSTLIGDMRFYGRTELAKLVGDVYASKHNITDLQNNISVNIDPILITGEAKGSVTNPYTLVTSVEIL